MATKKTGAMPMALLELVLRTCDYYRRASRARHLTVTVLIAISLFCPNLYALNGDLGGATQDGSADHPRLIQDLADFHEFTSDSSYGDDYTCLQCDPNWTNDLFEDDDENGYANDIYG